MGHYRYIFTSGLIIHSEKHIRQVGGREEDFLFVILFVCFCCYVRCFIFVSFLLDLLILFDVLLHFHQVEQNQISGFPANGNHNF